MDLAELARTPRRELERLHAAGTAPRIDDLVGWEFRGFNPPAFARLLGIQKFIKGFFRDDKNPDGPDEGYNLFAREDWTPRGRRHGFYVVSQGRGRFTGAVFLDYGASVRNSNANPERLLRDFLVHPDPDNRDLLLGKAFLALGTLVPVSFFLLERERETA